jgi:hypothetical protein
MMQSTAGGFMQKKKEKLEEIEEDLYMNRHQFLEVLII